MSHCSVRHYLLFKFSSSNIPIPIDIRGEVEGVDW